MLQQGLFVTNGVTSMTGDLCCVQNNWEVGKIRGQIVMSVTLLSENVGALERGMSSRVRILSWMIIQLVFTQLEIIFSQFQIPSCFKQGNKARV
jgi:hypothetical protein